MLARAAWQLLGEAAPAASAGAERHILGAGFVTLLILGEGANLLPGFAHRPLRSQWLVWATLSLGNLAAVLRVAPNLLPQLMPPAAAELVLASSGGVGVFTLVAFAANLGRLPARTEDEP